MAQLKLIFVNQRVKILSKNMKIIKDFIKYLEKYTFKQNIQSLCFTKLDNTGILV